MRFCLLVAVVCTLGCGSSTPSKMSDMAMASSGGDLALYSVCGHPGDTGNVNSVGKFCMDSMMCSGKSAYACSTLMTIPQGPTYFCTLACDPKAADPNAVCGTGASCTCLSASNPNLCGCVPNECRVGLFG